MSDKSDPATHQQQDRITLLAVHRTKCQSVYSMTYRYRRVKRKTKGFEERKEKRKGKKDKEKGMKGEQTAERKQ